MLAYISPYDDHSKYDTTTKLIAAISEMNTPENRIRVGDAIREREAHEVKQEDVFKKIAEQKASLGDQKEGSTLPDLQDLTEDFFREKVSKYITIINNPATTQCCFQCNNLTAGCFL